MNRERPAFAESLNEKGFALIPKVLSEAVCEALIQDYDDESRYRKTVQMERHRFGKGEYKYFTYPLPEIVQTLREDLYTQLFPIANLWMQVLKIDISYPGTLAELHAQCRAHKQEKATPLILKYGRGGYNTLHQDLYGDLYFPLQCVCFLSEMDKDYFGGEFVLTEQIPRAQSKAIVIRPNKGDMLIFATNFRPIKGSKGHYRAAMKHGVSEVSEGQRFTLGLIFHDATH